MLQMNETDEWFEVLSPGCSRPFYYSKKSGTSEWIRPAGRQVTLMPPPDGWLIPPPESQILTKFEVKKLSKIQFRDRVIKHVSEAPVASPAALISNQITDSHDTWPPEFFSDSCLPFDLYATPPLQVFVDYLRKTINPLTKGLVKKDTLTFQEALSPFQPVISGPMMSVTPEKRRDLSISMFKLITRYVNTGSLECISQIVRYVDPQQSDLVLECAVQVLTKANSLTIGPAVVRAWELFMLLTAKYSFPEPSRSQFLSFFLQAAVVSRGTEEIRIRAMICILRIASGTASKLNTDYPLEDVNFVPNFFKDSTSLTVRFGVGLAEVIEKERSMDIVHDKEICVPQILIELVELLIAKQALEEEGIFRVPGNHQMVKDAVIDINSGSYDLTKLDKLALASLTKRFIRDLPDPLLPFSVLEEITSSESPDSCIAILRGFPNPTRDTLMYFIGFCQLIIKNIEKTRMSANNIIVSIGNAFCLLKAESIEDLKSPQSLSRDRFLSCLIDYLDTSPVFNFKLNR
jgi:hypothetical protein